MYKKGQLFLIEVIIALSVMIVLVTTLFAIQSYSPPVQDNNLQERGEQAVTVLKESGLLWEYFDVVNRSYHELGDQIVASYNITKMEVIQTIRNTLPVTADFKAFTESYNSSSNQWVQLDIVNYENILPSGSDIETVEYYTPGFNGFEIEFKFQLLIWYEVN